MKPTRPLADAGEGVEAAEHPGDSLTRRFGALTMQPAASVT